MILALVRGINWNFQREESNGRPGEDEFLKVKFSSKASGCSLRARIIGRLHKITASELNKRTIKHIFITNEYSKFIFPNPGCHICFYLWGRYLEIFENINEDKSLHISRTDGSARPELSLLLEYNPICESRSLLCESEDSLWFMEEVFYLNAKSHTALLPASSYSRPAPVIISFSAKGWNLTKFGKIWAIWLNLWRRISVGARARLGVTPHTSHCVKPGPTLLTNLIPGICPGRGEKIQTKLLTFGWTYWLISEWDLLCRDETKETIRLPGIRGRGPGLKMRMQINNDGDMSRCPGDCISDHMSVSGQ